MTRLTTASQRIVRTPRQSVFVNGSLRRGVYCREIRMVEGIRPSEATFWVPQLTASADTSWLNEALIVVYVQGQEQPAFRGYTHRESAAENRQESGIVFTAFSILGLMDRVHVGQKREVGSVSYRQREEDDPESVQNWRLTTILENLFSQDEMPAEWRQLVALGTLVGFRTSRADPRLPDIRYEGSYIDAIRRVLDQSPDVGMYERFEHNRTVLDFQLIGRGQAGTETVIAATVNQGPERGAWVLDWKRERSTDRIYTRAIGYGRHDEYMVTTDIGHPTAPLEPAWEATEELNLLDPQTYGERESLVVQVPDRANPNRPPYGKAPNASNPEVIDDRDDITQVFRRWRLPLVLRENELLRRNPIDDSLGRSLNIQVFRAKWNFVGGEWDAGAEIPLQANGYKNDEWEEVRGFEIDEDGFLLLSEPSLGVNRYFADGSVGYGFLPVFITLTIARTAQEERVSYDTGQRGRVRYTGLSQEGLPFKFVNRSLARVSIGARDMEDTEEEGHDFNVLYHDPEDGWITIDQPEVIQDDQEFLAAVAERAIAERLRPANEIQVSTPIVAFPRVGAGLLFRNRGFDRTRFTINAVTIRLIGDGIGTSVRASDARPYSIDPANIPSAGMNDSNAPVSPSPEGRHVSGSIGGMDLLRSRGLPSIHSSTDAFGGPDDPTLPMGGLI